MIFKIKLDLQFASSFDRIFYFIFSKKSGFVTEFLFTPVTAFNSLVQTPGLICHLTAEVLNKRISILVNCIQFLNSVIVSKSNSSEKILAYKQNGGISKFKDAESIAFLSTEEPLNISQILDEDISETPEKLKIVSDLTATNLIFKNKPARQKYSCFFKVHLLRQGLHG